MKKIIAIVSLIILNTVAVSAQEINWVTLEEAQELMKKEPRKVMIDMYTTWCGPCKMLDKKTFANPDVAKYINKHYYAVKFNAEGNQEVTLKGQTYANPNYDASRRGRNAPHQLTRYLRVRAYPTMVFFDEDFNTIAPIAGYLRPKQLEIYLKMFKTDAHKEITSKEEWESYQKEFVHEFKN